MNLPLPLHLLAHAATGVLCFLFVAYKYRQNRWIAFTGAMLGAFFVDLDHVIDYAMAFGSHFNLYYFFKGFQFLKSDKIYIFFHAWEWVILLFIIYLLLRSSEFKRGTKWSSLFKRINKKAKESLAIFILALALGLTAHLLVDSTLNEMKLQSYTITYRMLQDFDLRKLVVSSHIRVHDSQKVIYLKYIKH